MKLFAKESSKVDQKIEEKRANLSKDVRIIRPGETFVSPETQAQWLIALLNKMYFEHGVSKNVQAVIDSIKSGREKYWFALEKGKPVAVVGLIDQGGKVEIGRAVSFAKTNGLGGLLYLEAARDQQLKSDKSLVAEVRAASEFKGIPGGVATLKLNYEYLNFFPHAFIPMFGHGNPYRQEFFLLGSDKKIEYAKSVVPDDNRVTRYLKNHGLGFANEFIQDHDIAKGKKQGSDKYEILMSSPISVVAPKENGSSLESVEKANKNPGILQVVELAPHNMSALISLLNNNYIPVGIDSETSGAKNSVLLLYKLNASTLLAPNVFEKRKDRRLIQSLFSREQLQIFDQISRSTRK